MTKIEMTVKIARAEGMMLGLYGMVRDCIIGDGVKADQDSDLAILVGEQEQNLSDVYKAIEDGLEDGEAQRIPGRMCRCADDDEDRP